jgi:hypothetical protein
MNDSLFNQPGPPPSESLSKQDQPFTRSDAAPQRTPQRWVSRPLILGIVVGFIPVGLTAAYLFIPAVNALFLFDDSVSILLGLYGAAWVGAIPMAVFSKHQIRRSLAKGVLIGLASSTAMTFCAVGGFIVWLLVYLQSCNCLS